MDEVDFAEDDLAGQGSLKVVDAWNRLPDILRDAVELAEIAARAITPLGLVTTWIGEECGEFDRRTIPSSSSVRNSSLVGISFSGGSLWACVGTWGLWVMM